MATPDEAQRALMVSVLREPSTQKICFKLANYTVTSWSFNTVIGLLKMGAVTIKIGPLPQGVLAGYKPTFDLFWFPRYGYGRSVQEKSAIVHESVHCWNDYNGNGKKNRALDNESAGYIAEALYLLDVTNGHLPYIAPEARDLMNKAFAIAKKINSTKNSIPVIDGTDLEILRYAVHKAMKNIAGYDIDRFAEDNANGVSSPLSILAPIEGL
jgi:hypothetical protein